jgi:hypothetical protein
MIIDENSKICFKRIYSKFGITDEKIGNEM